jgi:choline dehydrogenase
VGVVLATPSGGEEEVAGRRIVLAAGAVNTPAILIRSGIGPEEDLRRLGIDIRVAAAGVGENLVDHPRSGVYLGAKGGSFEPGDPFLQTVVRTTMAGSSQFNDMQYYMVNSFDLGLFPELRMLAGADTVLGVMLVHQRPESRGRVTVTSTDPGAAPQVQLNFLATERDVQTLLGAVRASWALANATGVRSLGHDFIVLRDKTIDDDELVLEYIRMSLDSGYHPVGTARMGTSDDPGAVVSERLDVHGTDGLFVVDASVMPNIVSCNTNLTSIMIGERASDFLR